MTDTTRLETALVNADKAGDVAAASVIAGELRKLRIVGLRLDGKEVKPSKMFTPSGEKSVPSITDPEMIAANPVIRGALNAAEPFLGAGQIVANVVGLGKPVNEHLKQLQGIRQRGQEFVEGEGIDYMGRAAGAAGIMLSPAALKIAKALNPAASTAGRIVQGGAIGAAFGAATPVTDGGEDFWTEKADQTGVGGAAGLALPLGWEGAKAGGRLVRNVLDPMLPGGATRAAGRLGNMAAGDKTDDVIAALQSQRSGVPGVNLTAGQASVPAGSLEFAALQRMTAEKVPSPAYFIESQQRAARERAIQGIAGGADDTALNAAIKTRGENAAEAYGAVRGDRIDPRSQVGIMEDAIRSRQASKASALQDQGRFATTAAQNEVRGANFTPVPGMPRVSSRASNFPDRVQEAVAAAADTATVANLRGKEKAFLESTMDLMKQTVGLEDKSLGQFLTRPSMRAAVNDAIKSAKETGVYFPSKAGDRFSVQNLQRIKESLDAGIRASKASADMGRRPELSPEELEGTKKAFVAWLSNKSPGWKAARLGYAEDSIPINQMQVGRELEKRLVNPSGNETGGTFLRSLDDAAKTIKKATDGKSRYEKIEQALNPNQVATARNVASDLERNIAFNEIATKGMSAAREKVGAFNDPLPQTNFLERTMMIINAITRRIEGKASAVTMKELSLKMENPEEMARIMQAAKPFERQQIIDTIMRLQAPGAAGMATQGGAQ